MRSWAEWRAKTALVAVGFAAAGGVLAGASGIGPPANASVLDTRNVTAPVSLSADVCGIAGALLGITSADCLGDATTVTHLPGQGSSGAAGPGSGRGIGVGRGHAVSVPVSVPADVCGDTAAVPGRSTASCAGGAGSSTAVGSPDRTAIEHMAAPPAAVLGPDGPQAGVGPVSGLTSSSGVARPGIHGLRAAGASASAPGAGRTFDASSGASSGTGGTGVPDASQPVGLGTLPDLADLPSLAGVANMAALNGENGSAIPMPGTTLSAANAAGMSSNSYAALAVGSLLAGASALKIAGRRARDRKAGIGVATGR